jgi:hypothetical protein
MSLTQELSKFTTEETKAAFLAGVDFGMKLAQEPVEDGLCDRGCDYYNPCMKCQEMIPLDDRTFDDDLFNRKKDDLRSAIHMLQTATNEDEKKEGLRRWYIAHNALEFYLPGSSVGVEVEMGFNDQI